MIDQNNNMGLVPGAECFIRIDDKDINELGELIKAEDDNEVNGKTIASLLGNILAFERNVAKKKDDFLRKMVNFYLYVANTKYTGQKIVFDYHVLDENNRIEKQLIEDLKDADGLWGKDPTKLLLMLIENIPMAIYSPTFGCFIPFDDHEFDADKFDLDKYSESAKKRCLAIIYLLKENYIEQQYDYSPLKSTIGENNDDLFTKAGKVFDIAFDGDREKATYLAEEKEEIETNGNIRDVVDYLKSGAANDAKIVCCLLGKNDPGKLTKTLTLLATCADEDEINGKSLKLVIHETRKDEYGDDEDVQQEISTMILLPVQNSKSVTDVNFDIDPDNPNNPLWIEFTAKVDGVPVHKVYNKPEQGWFYCSAPALIDLQAGVPNGILQIFNYALIAAELNVQSANLNDFVDVLGIEQDQVVRWEAYPNANHAHSIINTNIKQESFTIIQRDKPISKLELMVQDTVLGTIIYSPICQIPGVTGKLYISIDPAGTTSVRLQAVGGILKNKAPVPYKKTVVGITPISNAKLEEYERTKIPCLVDSSDKFDSLIQLYSSKEINGYNYYKLNVDQRIWVPDLETRFESFVGRDNGPDSKDNDTKNSVDKEKTFTLESAASAIGVVSNPKELISRSLNTDSVDTYIESFMYYLAQLIFDSILSAAKQGYTIANNKLVLSISYPDNGKEDNITQKMEEIIDDAITHVNNYLTPPNQLILGDNVKKFSESAAANAWMHNLPEGLGGANTATIDIGYSTDDFSMRLGSKDGGKDKLYASSIPYAGYKITTSTIAKVFNGNNGQITVAFGNNLDNSIQDKANKIFDLAYKNAEKNEVAEQLSFSLMMDYLFKTGSFNMANIDKSTASLLSSYTELKLNVALPIYAKCICDALEDDTLSAIANSKNTPSSKKTYIIQFCPAGKGSKAFENVAQKQNYSQRISLKIDALVKELMKERGMKNNDDINIQIVITENYDSDKYSVAEGLISLADSQTNAANFDRRNDEDKVYPYYIDSLYEDDAENKNQKDKFTELKEQSKFGGIDNLVGNLDDNKDFEGYKNDLKNRYFIKLVNNYTFEDFIESYKLFLYLPHMNSALLRKISSYATQNFQTLKNIVKQKKISIVLSCFGVEKYMLAGAILDTILEEM